MPLQWGDDVGSGGWRFRKTKTRMPATPAQAIVRHTAPRIVSSLKKGKDVKGRERKEGRKEGSKRREAGGRNVEGLLAR